MAVYKTRIIDSALLEKGFKKTNGRHVKYILYKNEEATPIYTFLSHGSKEYDDYLLGEMKKELCISKYQLTQLIECPLGKDELIRILTDKGKI